MSAAMSDSEVIYVSKLRRTETLEHGRVRQIFDVVNLPGLEVVCVSQAGEEGDLQPVSQEYRLATGEAFRDLDTALLAWDDMADHLALLDAVGEMLVRYRHGLMRPLWSERTPEQKEPWLTMARQFLQLAGSLDLSITKRMRQ